MAERQATEGLQAEIEKLKTAGISDQEIVEKLDTIRDELAEITIQQQNQTLGSTAGENESSNFDQIRISDDHQADSPLGYIVIRDRGQDKKIYREPDLTSRVVGFFEFNQEYPFFKNQGQWFRITLPDKTEGWVETQFGEETETIP